MAEANGQIYNSRISNFTVIEKGMYVIFLTGITMGGNYSNIYPTLTVNKNGTAVDNAFLLYNTEAYGGSGTLVSAKITAIVALVDASAGDVISMNQEGRWASYQIYYQN